MTAHRRRCKGTEQKGKEINLGLYLQTSIEWTIDIFQHSNTRLHNSRVFTKCTLKLQEQNEEQKFMNISLENWVLKGKIINNATSYSPAKLSIIHLHEQNHQMGIQASYRTTGETQSQNTAEDLLKKKKKGADMKWCKTRFL